MALINGTNGNDSLNATIGHDTINGLAGNDSLFGLAGDDILDGGTGADRMEGGDGNDTYIVDTIGDQIIEDSNPSNPYNQYFTDTVKSSITWTLSDVLESLILTGNAAINGTGNVGDNTLIGNAADNTLTGGAGNDFLAGGGGRDILNGGAGSDTYIIRDTNDTIIESANSGIDTVESFVS